MEDWMDSSSSVYGHLCSFTRPGDLGEVTQPVLRGVCRWLQPLSLVKEGASLLPSREGDGRWDPAWDSNCGSEQLSISLPLMRGREEALSLLPLGGSGIRPISATPPSQLTFGRRGRDHSSTMLPSRGRGDVCRGAIIYTLPLTRMG